MIEPKANDRISEYLLIEQLGAGSFGEVWKARHHIWEDQIVAIKIATDPQYVRNLQREGVTIHGLRHDNIVRAIGLDPYASPPYLVMEYVEGPTLREVIDANPNGVPLEVALVALRGLLEGLKFAHENGVTHRDVKPANVMIASTADLEQLTPAAIRITDFGLGRAAGLTTTSIMQSGSLLTEEGKSISGTMAYMAPEQRDGLEIDARADLYACGIVLFELVTGKRPQGGDLPSHLKPQLPTWLDEFFARCYTRRERRFASAQEMLDELGRHAQATRPPRVKPVPPLPRAKPVSHANGRKDDFCEKCGHKLDPDDNFCIMCGHQVCSKPRQCQACGAYPDPHDTYCDRCGASLTRKNA
jgi:serine/threonine protein kinase